MNYEQQGDVAILKFDDGKANAVSHEFMDSMNEGLDRAEKEAKAVVIHGRPGRFSGGFDLSEIRKGPDAAQALVKKGARMFFRMYTHPQPLVEACTGHAVAAGAFLLLASDTRVGTQGNFKLGLNEVAIGMSLPVFGLELSSARLSKRHLTAAVIQSQMYSPAEAVDAGFLDHIFNEGEVLEKSIEMAAQLAQLPGAAYASMKRDIRRESIDRIEKSLD